MNKYYQKYREKQLAYSRKYRLEHPDYFKKYSLEHPDRIKMYRQRYVEKQKEYYANWYKENGRVRADNYQESILEWKQAFPERVKIQRQLQYAVKTGKIKRPEICSKCGRKSRIHAHHINYNHFMNFVWLCASCHKKIHINNT